MVKKGEKSELATIYIPNDYINNCNVVYNGFIRSFTNAEKTEWVDIFPNQNYMVQSGSSIDSQSVVCDSLNTYTTNSYYKIGQLSEWFSMLTLAFVFAIFLLNIRRFAKYDFA